MTKVIPDFVLEREHIFITYCYNYFTFIIIIIIKQDSHIHVHTHYKYLIQIHSSSEHSLQYIRTGFSYTPHQYSPCMSVYMYQSVMGRGSLLSGGTIIIYLLNLTLSKRKKIKPPSHKTKHLKTPISSLV